MCLETVTRHRLQSHYRVIFTGRGKILRILPIFTSFFSILLCSLTLFIIQEHKRSPENCIFSPLFNLYICLAYRCLKTPWCSRLPKLLCHVGPSAKKDKVSEGERNPWQGLLSLTWESNQFPFVTSQRALFSHPEEDYCQDRELFYSQTFSPTVEDCQVQQERNLTDTSWLINHPMHLQD